MQKTMRRVLYALLALTAGLSACKKKLPEPPAWFAAMKTGVEARLELFKTLGARDFSKEPIVDELAALPPVNHGLASHVAVARRIEPSGMSPGLLLFAEHDGCETRANELIDGYRMPSTPESDYRGCMDWLTGMELIAIARPVSGTPRGTLEIVELKRAVVRKRLPFDGSAGWETDLAGHGRGKNQMEAREKAANDLRFKQAESLDKATFAGVFRALGEK